MNPLLVSLVSARTYEVRSSTRYFWDSRQRGGGTAQIFQYSWAGTGGLRDERG